MTLIHSTASVNYNDDNTSINPLLHYLLLCPLLFDHHTPSTSRFSSLPSHGNLRWTSPLTINYHSSCNGAHYPITMPCKYLGLTISHLLSLMLLLELERLNLLDCYQPRTVETWLSTSRYKRITISVSIVLKVAVFELRFFSCINTGYP